MDVGQIKAKRQTLHLALHGVATDAEVTRQEQFHTGLQLCLLRHSLHQHVTQLFIKLSRSQEEVHLQVINLLHLEHIGIVTGRRILQIIDFQYLTAITDFSIEQRHVELAAESTIVEVVLNKAGLHLVE